MSSGVSISPAARIGRGRRAERGPNGLRRLADSDLLVRISRRDLGAFEVLYDRHIEAAWKVAVAYSDDVPAAERAVEAAFVGLWREPDPGARASLPARLLAGVAREARARPEVGR